MKQCPFCANVLNDNDEFCNNCGNKVSDTADVSKQPQDAKKKKESKGSKTALIIIIAVLAVLLIGAVTVFVLDVTGAVDISAIFSGEEKDEDKETEVRIEKESDGDESSTFGTDEKPSENHTERPPEPSDSEQSSEVNTVAIKAVYVISNDVSEEQVYELTKALWETQAVKMSHAKAAEMDIYSTLDGLGEVPLHPGAARYYIEKGIISAGDVNIASAGNTVLDKIKVGTGGNHGTYYAFAIASLQAISNGSFNFEVISSGGSAANLNGINDGTYHMATVQSDVMNYAYEGLNGFDTPITSFSAIGCIYPEVCQLMVTENSGINSISDLKGKKVAIGDIGSGVYYNAVQILEAAGLDPEKDIYPIYCSFGDSVTGLKDGSIDAAFITAGTPSTAVTELAASTKIKAIGLSNSVINKLIGENSFYVKHTLTNADYDFIPESDDSSSVYTITDGVLTMATNAVFPPYEFKEGEGFKGIDIEIAEKIAEKLGLTLEIQDVEFGSIVGGVKYGKFDIGMAGITVTEERLEDVNFSTVYVTGVQVVIVKEDSGIKSLGDLKADGSMKYGVQQDTTGDIYASDTVDNGGYGRENVTSFKTGAEAVEALKTGKVDAIILDKEPAQEFVNANTDLKLLDGDWVVENYAICVAKDNTELLRAINEALNELQSDGTIDAIIDKYI